FLDHYYTSYLGQLLVCLHSYFHYLALIVVRFLLSKGSTSNFYCFNIIRTRSDGVLPTCFLNMASNLSLTSSNVKGLPLAKVSFNSFTDTSTFSIPWNSFFIICTNWMSIRIVNDSLSINAWFRYFSSLFNNLILFFISASFRLVTKVSVQLVSNSSNDSSSSSRLTLICCNSSFGLKRQCGQIGFCSNSSLVKFQQGS